MDADHSAHASGGEVTWPEAELNRTHLIELSQDGDLSKQATIFRMGNIELSDGQKIEFSRWYHTSL